MEQLWSTVVTLLGVAFVLLVIGAVLGSIVTGRQIRDAIAAQPAPVIHNTATANAGGDGGGSGVAIGLPQIVGLLGGLALLAWAATGFKTGVVTDQPAQQTQAVAVPIATAAQMPTVAATAAPTAAPVATIAPVAEPVRQPEIHPLVIVPQPERSINWLHVAIGVLAIAAIGLWVYVGVMLIGRKRVRRSNVQRRPTTDLARERKLEEMIPDMVRDLEP